MGSFLKPGQWEIRQKNDDVAFSILMNFFCHEWTGRDGDLRGCQVNLLSANLVAWEVFARTGINAGAADLQAAMKMSGVSDVNDCWNRIQILAEEFRKVKR